MVKYIIVSIGKGYGDRPIDKYDCGLKPDFIFDANLNYAKKFDSKKDAIEQLNELYEERKQQGFRGNFFVREIVSF